MISSTYMLQIPQVDKAFFDTLVKKMGWTASSVEVPMETLAALELWLTDTLQAEWTSVMMQFFRKSKLY